MMGIEMKASQALGVTVAASCLVAMAACSQTASPPITPTSAAAQPTTAKPQATTQPDVKSTVTAPSPTVTVVTTVTAPPPDSYTPEDTYTPEPVDTATTDSDPDTAMAKERAYWAQQDPLTQDGYCRDFLADPAGTWSYSKLDSFGISEEQFMDFYRSECLRR